jgi:hypothetical protein
MSHDSRTTLSARVAHAPLSRAERGLCLAVLALLVVAVVMPPVPQDQRYHAFADARTMLGLPHAMDVLSNACFLALGMLGLAWHRAGRIAYGSHAMRSAGAVFFVGFVLTAFGSAYYHLAPDDASLAWDRLGMVVAFAGVLGLAAAHRVSARAGQWLWPIALACGVLSVAWSRGTGSLTPYLVVQFGGIALVAGLAWLPAHGRGPNWAAMIAAYALAKAFETADHQVFELTGGIVSGHTLKHVLASLAMLAVLVPLRRHASQDRPRVDLGS